MASIYRGAFLRMMILFRVCVDCCCILSPAILGSYYVQSVFSDLALRIRRAFDPLIDDGVAEELVDGDFGGDRVVANSSSSSRGVSPMPPPTTTNGRKSESWGGAMGQLISAHSPAPTRRLFSNRFAVAAGRSNRSDDGGDDDDPLLVTGMDDAMLALDSDVPVEEDPSFYRVVDDVTWRCQDVLAHRLVVSLYSDTLRDVLLDLELRERDAAAGERAGSAAAIAKHSSCCFSSSLRFFFFFVCLFPQGCLRRQQQPAHLVALPGQGAKRTLLLWTCSTSKIASMSFRDYCCACTLGSWSAR